MLSATEGREDSRPGCSGPDDWTLAGGNERAARDGLGTVVKRWHVLIKIITNHNYTEFLLSTAYKVSSIQFFPYKNTGKN